MNHSMYRKRTDETSVPGILNSQFSILHSPRAFTLVELLVVIAIIGVLATLITAAATAARQYVKVARIKMEMHQIEMALEQYKNTYGEYPPDFYDDAAVVRHVMKRWPRFNIPGGNVSAQAASIRAAINNVYTDATIAAHLRNHDVSHPLDANNVAVVLDNTLATRTKGNLAALAVWLGGFPNSDGKFIGFSADPQAPFGRRLSSNAPNDGSNIDFTNSNYPTTAPIGNVVIVEDKGKVIMDLEIGKQITFAYPKNPSGTKECGFPVLVQKKGEGEFLPYVYFRGRNDGGSGAYLWTGILPKFYNFNIGFVNDVWINCGHAVPYAQSGGDPFDTVKSPRDNVVWYNSEKYQLLHPGLGGGFGSIGLRPPASVMTDPFDENYFKTTSDELTGTSQNSNNIGQHDMDNIVNFGEGTIKASLP